MAKKRVLMLVHKDLVPPEKVNEEEVPWETIPWIAEYDVLSTLKKMKYDVQPLGVGDNLGEIRQSIETFQPHIVFNLLEEFAGEAVFDQNVVSFLELMNIPYTGCNPRGLILARDKALAKKILAYHRIRTARFAVFPRNLRRSRPKSLDFPLIVKCLNEEASMGISRASVVTSDEKLMERVRYIHERFRTDAIAEEFIEGKEYFIGVIGNYRLQTFPPWELQFKNAENPEKEFYSSNAKHNVKYREKHGIATGPADVSKELLAEMFAISKRAYRALNMNGYARIDLRVNKDGRIFLLEANPNPDISEEEDFATSARAAKISYRNLLKKIINLGLQWNPTNPIQG